MRNFLAIVAVLVTVHAAPAEACPRTAVCVMTLDSHAIEVAAAPKPQKPIKLALEARASDRGPWRFDDAPRVPATSEMPWIWQVLRLQVYARMPRYEERELSFTLSPVVVTGSFDTVPGVGIAGDF
ncbi:MAG: hypothetical protein H0T89_36760 [Deltaproteobacteria bacterium]|nr:hypothetical protein [Deltaproteobacteria bacterium]MDQ3300788.1 hypothetical protein [Myxococcota bacterium]